MKKITVGVIGLGNMGRHHARHYSLLENAQLEWVCDADKARANQYAETYHCKAYTSVEEALSHPVDAVSIAAPTSLHAPLGKLALEKGCHVLMEKPLSETPQQGQALIDLAHKKNLRLSVGHVEQFNPAIIVLKNMINDGKLGRLISLSSQRMSMFPNQIKDANVVLDLAVHDLDIFSFLMQQRPLKITGKSCKAIIQDRADSADIFVEYADAAGTIQVNWICPIKVRTLRVLGTKGLVELDYIASTLKYTPSDYTLHKDTHGCETAQFTPTDTTLIPIPQHDALQRQLHHFIDAIQGNPSDTVTGEMGLHALKDALAALA